MKTLMPIATILMVIGSSLEARVHSARSEFRVVVWLDLRGSDLPVPTVTMARLTASAIFRAEGIEIDWRNKAPANQDTSSGVRLEFIATPPATYGTTTENLHTLAYAEPFNSSGRRIVVFCDRVHRYIAPHDAAAGIVLANIFAHELAHVLQGIARHSKTGVMKPSWSAVDLSNMKSGRLQFSTEDRDYLRAGMSRCTAMAAESAAMKN